MLVIYYSRYNTIYCVVMLIIVHTDFGRTYLGHYTTQQIKQWLSVE